MLSASPARLAISTIGGFGAACAAVEGLPRALAAELGPQGVRVVCRRPHRRGETVVDADLPVPRDELICLITIMVLEMEVPHGIELGALQPLFPVLVSYVLSFVYIGIYWNNHHHMLYLTERVSGRRSSRPCSTRLRFPPPSCGRGSRAYFTRWSH